MGATVTGGRVHRRQLSLWRNAVSDIWETRVGIWRLITLIILSILLLTQLVSDKLACVPSQLNGLCRKKQIGHIYQSCRNSHRTNSAHLPNLCIMEIPILTVCHFINYLPSEVITSHSFQLSNPVFAHQQKIAKSASELSDLVFGNFWQQKSWTRTEVVPD